MMRNETRQALVRAGGEIIVRRGYNNTGINAVLSAAGVPKGSFYYYFENKEAFGLAVIDDFDDRQTGRLDALLADETVPPVQRIRNYFESGIEEVAAHDCGRGCLVGNLGQELAAQNEVFRGRLNEVFQCWKRRFAGCLEQARETGEIDADADTDELAEFLLCGWEGALLRAKVAKSVAPMRAFRDLFLARVLKTK